MLLSREMTFKSLCRGVFNFDINMNNKFLKKSYDISNTALIMALQTIFTTNSPIFIHFGCFRWLAGLLSLTLLCHLVLWCYVQYLFPHHRQVVWFSRPEGQHRNHHRDHYPWHHLHPELLSIHARHQHHYCTSFTVSGARGYGYNFSIISHRQMNNDFLHS